MQWYAIYPFPANRSNTDAVHFQTQCFGLIHGVTVVARPNLIQVVNSQVYKELVVDKGVPAGARPIEKILRLKKLTETKKTPATDVYIRAIDELHE